MLVESVRIATRRDLAPAIDADATLVRAFARRHTGALAEVPLPALIRTTLHEPNDAWVAIIGERLAAVENPHAIAPLLHDFRDLCARRLAALDPGHEDDREAIELALDHASALLAH